MRKYFSTIGKSYHWWGTKHGGFRIRFGELRFFWWRSMSMHVHLRILCIYFLRYQESSHPENSNPENFHRSNPHPGKSPLENSHPEKSHLEYCHYNFKYSHPSFLDENFLGSNFPVLSLMGRGVISRVGIPPGAIFIESSSLYNVSVLIFQKIINKYYDFQ